VEINKNAFSSNVTTVREAVAKAEQRAQDGTWGFKPANPILYDALLSVACRGTVINSAALGTYLRSAMDKVVALEDGAKVRFERGEARNGSATWRLSGGAGTPSATAGGSRGDPDDIRY
jgi:hypothetical protein